MEQICNLFPVLTGQDPELERYRSRLDGAVPRVMNKLRQYVQAELGECNQDLATRYAALPQKQRFAIVEHPHFCYWWLKTMERLQAGDRVELENWLHHFSRFLLVPLLEAGTWPDTPVPVTVYKRQLRFPGHPLHIELPPGEEGPLVQVSLTDGVLQIQGQADRYEVSVQRLLTGWGESPLLVQRPILESNIELDAGEEWVEYLFQSINGKQAAMGEPGNFLKQLDPVPSVIRKNFETASELLAEVWPELWQELRSYTKLIIPYESNYSSTFTEAAFMGAVFMSESRQPFADEMYTAEHLLHEHSHLRLTLMLEVDPMFIPQFTDNRYKSPFRRDARPLSGIFHGAFVFARIAEFLARGLRLGKEDRYRVRLGEVVRDLEEALRVLEENATYTERGRALMNEMADVVVRMRQEFSLESAEHIA